MTTRKNEHFHTNKGEAANEMSGKRRKEDQRENECKKVTLDFT